MAESNEETRMLTRQVNVMSVQPCEMPGNPEDQRLVLSIEKHEGEIEALLISHEDGHLLLSELLESMASQGCVVAELILKVLNDTTEEDQDEEADEESASGEDIGEEDAAGGDGD